ncbi:hypothetical protein FQN54_003730 [Arachnomyces sp. PD_36]|nr:hypothetical protein FQN54_003730 [Arachnomyces sp. PD_36]
MKVLALLAAASIAVAVPTPQQDPPHIPPEDLIWPAETYRYWVKTGETELDPISGLVQKNGNQDEEITTLVNFQFPEELEGRTCRLRFDLWERDTSEGSKRADVFTSLAPEGFSIASEAVWPPGNKRDVHVGRIIANAPGSAVWEQQYHGFPEFPCPAGRVLGGEFVGVGDKDKIEWDIGVTGPRIEVLE